MTHEADARAHVRRLTAEGATDVEMAGKLGLSSGYVRNLRREMGLAPNQTRRSTDLSRFDDDGVDAAEAWRGSKEACDFHLDDLRSAYPKPLVSLAIREGFARRLVAPMSGATYSSPGAMCAEGSGL